MKNTWYICVLLFLVVSCSESPNKVKKPFEQGNVKEPLIAANQNAVRQEDEDINLYIKRQKLNAIRTETGLRYQITKEGQGQLIKAKNKVTLDYETFSIDGNLLYSSKESGVKMLEVEKNNEVQALDEILKLMKNGAEAHMVIPSHLAYGIAGDGNKIRQRIPIVMKIKVLNVK